ncbi:MAG: DUF4145 domain-containing protein [Alphaproteobacteria bacterium]|nr:DUF4145 domain-containing protein [Alphaproteobacteria bacterium]
MTAANKDSLEVIAFRHAFLRLKRLIGDETDALSEDALRDSDLRNLVVLLGYAASEIRNSEGQSQSAFTSPVDPRFLESWREYERDYERPVSEACRTVAREFPEFAELHLPFIPDPRQAWDWFWSDVAGQQDELDDLLGMIGNALEEREEDEGSIELPDELAELGRAAWLDLTNSVPLDVDGIIRRRALLPFVLIPRHVANRYGSSEKRSLAERLRQAQEAFIYGLPLAALALLRSIVEVSLRDHYRSSGSGLTEMIGNAKGLTGAANAAALHRLRQLANAALHDGDHPSLEAAWNTDKSLELEMTRLFVAVRDLIEHAPSAPPR